MAASISIQADAVEALAQDGRRPIKQIIPLSVAKSEGQLVAKTRSTRWRPTVTKKDLQAILSVLALTASLMAYGILQERIMTVPFGPEGHKFRFTLFLVMCNRVLACFLALVYVWWSNGTITPVAPIQSYSMISVANVISSACQYEALKYVSFPVQVLAKCTKMIPVMIWQSVIARKTYSVREYLEAAVVALGCAVFLLTGNVKAAGVPGTHHSGAVYFMGGGIMVTYLAVDGFTSTWQDWLFTGYQMDIGNQVLYTTMCSTVLSSTALMMSGKLTQALQFVSMHPEVWWWIVGISIASAAVQFLVTHTIKEYGALVFATVMTTRQWFSILLSCLIFAHPLSTGQCFGTVMVFGALYRRFYERHQAQRIAQQ